MQPLIYWRLSRFENTDIYIRYRRCIRLGISCVRHTKSKKSIFINLQRIIITTLISAAIKSDNDIVTDINRAGKL